MAEAWKPISGYDGDYYVSNHGRVKSLKYNQSRILSQGLSATGYLIVALCKDGKPKTQKVHRLVALAFHGEPPEGKPNVLHKDDSYTNNNASNLYWGDQKDNARDELKNGGHLNRGEHCADAKLTEEEVLEIRATYPLGCFTQKDLSEAYGVGPDQISRIINRKRWAHI